MPLNVIGMGKVILLIVAPFDAALLDMQVKNSTLAYCFPHVSVAPSTLSIPIVDSVLMTTFEWASCVIWSAEVQTKKNACTS